MRLEKIAVVAMVALAAVGCARRVRVSYSAQAQVQSPVVYAQPGYAQPPPAQPAYAPPPPPPSFTAQAQAQLLYLPVGGIAVSLVQSIVVQSDDGRVFQLGPSDVQPALAGRLALRLPAGVTTGTVTLYAMGQSISIPFHIAAMIGDGTVIGSAPPASHPGCAVVAGRWVGNITDEPSARAIADLEILGDCRTVRGFMHLESPSTGSVDSTVVGTWDAGSYRLVAQDTQLFNVRARPGGSFCPTVQYDLQLQSDGTLVGRNVVTDPACQGVSPVYLRRH